MANPDKARGFVPVKSLLGVAWNGLVRKLGVTDGTDIFVGTPVKIASNLIAVAASLRS